MSRILSEAYSKYTFRVTEVVSCSFDGLYNSWVVPFPLKVVPENSMKLDSRESIDGAKKSADRVGVYARYSLGRSNTCIMELLTCTIGPREFVQNRRKISLYLQRKKKNGATRRLIVFPASGGGTNNGERTGTEPVRLPALDMDVMGPIFEHMIVKKCKWNAVRRHSTITDTR